MRATNVLMLALLLPLAGCASMGAANNDDPTAGLENADIARSTAGNGDLIEEYRIGGRLEVVKVTPKRGPVYYLMDRDGDGKPDDGATVSPVMWKLFEWN